MDVTFFCLNGFFLAKTQHLASSPGPVPIAKTKSSDRRAFKNPSHLTPTHPPVAPILDTSSNGPDPQSSWIEGSTLTKRVFPARINVRYQEACDANTRATKAKAGSESWPEARVSPLSTHRQIAPIPQTRWVKWSTVHDEKLPKAKKRNELTQEIQRVTATNTTS